VNEATRSICKAKVYKVKADEKDFMFTSESVTEGHPDKLCDQISDAIVDRFLQQDPYARVITECAVATGIVFIAARFEPNANVDFTNIARQVIGWLRSA